MNNIIEFYNNLDTLNIIIFWGIILVIILLTAFVILMYNRKKKKNNFIESQIENEYNDQIALKELNEIEEPIKNELTKKTDEKIVEIPLTKEHEEINEITEEPVFEPEELILLPEKENKLTEKITKSIDDIEIPKKPYQKNVLRDIYPSQTSPIGIIKPKETNSQPTPIIKEEENTIIPEIEASTDFKQTATISDISYEEEYEPTTNNDEPIIEEFVPSYEETSSIIEKENEISILEEPIVEPAEEISEEAEKELEFRYTENLKPQNEEIAKEYHYEEYHDENKDNTYKESNEEYLEEVSRKLSNAENIDQVNRTEYEIQQEEEAIISYEELMQKKDSIKMIDEEEAIISIEELMQKKQEEEKLYKLTEDEGNNDFINELKNFRNDL